MSKMNTLCQVTPSIISRCSVVCLGYDAQRFEVWGYPFPIMFEHAIWKSIIIPVVQTFFHTLLAELLEGTSLK